MHDEMNGTVKHMDTAARRALQTMTAAALTSLETSLAHVDQIGVFIKLALITYRPRGSHEHCYANGPECITPAINTVVRHVINDKLPRTLLDTLFACDSMAYREFVGSWRPDINVKEFVA